MTIARNRKKIRGWKRQIKRLEQWKNNNIQLDLRHSDHDYVKIWLDPWYRLERRNPPHWFRRLILAALFEIYESWQRTLNDRGEPYYLRIWLYDQRFIRSQVVAATRDRLGWYEEMFVRIDESRPFPAERHLQSGFRHDDYIWTLHADEDPYFEKSDELTADDIEHLKRVAYRVVELSDGQRMYTVKKGDLWLGERFLA